MKELVEVKKGRKALELYLLGAGFFNPKTWENKVEKAKIVDQFIKQEIGQENENLNNIYFPYFGEYGKGEWESEAFGDEIISEDGSEIYYFTIENEEDYAKEINMQIDENQLKETKKGKILFFGARKTWLKTISIFQLENGQEFIKENEIF